MILVSAAIIRDSQNKILICQREEGGPCSLLWEFPGGKQERGEDAEACVVRECEEELGVVILTDGLFLETEYAYPDREIHFSFFWAHIALGEPEFRVHKNMAWVSAEEFDDYVFCPADVGIVEKLKEQLLQN